MKKRREVRERSQSLFGVPFTPEQVNLMRTAIEQQLNHLLPNLSRLPVAFESLAKERSGAQLEVHERVREASRIGGA